MKISSPIKWSLAVVAGLVLTLSGITSPAVHARGYHRKNIVDFVLYANKRYGEFDTLIAALIKTELLDAVRDGEVTVFAPTDRAFKEIGFGPDEVNGLEGDEVGFLKDVLLYHVTAGRVGYRELKRKELLLMLNGDPTKIRCWRYRAFINDSKIFFGIPAGNGNLFVINKVLLPPEV